MGKIEDIITSIKSSQKTNNYFASFTSSLVLIDICSALEYKNINKQSNERYKLWIENFLLNGTFFSADEYLDASNIWHLRCALLHEGSANPNTQKSYSKWANKKVDDIVPVSDLGSPKKIFSAKYDGETILFFDINYFVDGIIKAVENWKESSPKYNQESEKKIFSIAYSFCKDDGKMRIMRKQ